jgi:hypothetical protein
MPFRVFTLQCTEDGVFDDADLHTFSQEHQVLTCSKDFYFHRNEPKMVVFVEYRPKKKKSFIHKPARMGSPSNLTETGKLRLTPSQKNLYETLRNWRNQKGKQEGKPLMNIFTNEQLEDIIRLLPRSVADFRKISGIGQAKSQRYGAELLVLLHQTPASEGVRGKEAATTTVSLQHHPKENTDARTEDISISRTEDTHTLGTENMQPRTGDKQTLSSENPQRKGDETGS